jgi:hypothetical protein
MMYWSREVIGYSRKVRGYSSGNFFIARDVPDPARPRRAKFTVKYRSDELAAFFRLQSAKDYAQRVCNRLQNTPIADSNTSKVVLSDYGYEVMVRHRPPRRTRGNRSYNETFSETFRTKNLRLLEYRLKDVLRAVRRASNVLAANNGRFSIRIEDIPGSDAWHD